MIRFQLRINGALIFYLSTSLSVAIALGGCKTQAPEVNDWKSDCFLTSAIRETEKSENASPDVLRCAGKALLREESLAEKWNTWLFRFCSVVVVSDGANDANQTYENSVYGQALDSDPYLFTGRRLDSETGLYYYWVEYYNLNIGRSMQTDPNLEKTKLGV